MLNLEINKHILTVNSLLRTNFFTWISEFSENKTFDNEVELYVWTYLYLFPFSLPHLSFRTFACIEIGWLSLLSSCFFSSSFFSFHRLPKNIPFRGRIFSQAGKELGVSLFPARNEPSMLFPYTSFPVENELILKLTKNTASYFKSNNWDFSCMKEIQPTLIILQTNKLSSNNVE